MTSGDFNVTVTAFGNMIREINYDQILVIVNLSTGIFPNPCQIIEFSGGKLSARSGSSLGSKWTVPGGSGHFIGRPLLLIGTVHFRPQSFGHVDAYRQANSDDPDESIIFLHSEPDFEYGPYNMNHVTFFCQVILNDVGSILSVAVYQPYFTEP